MNHIYVAGLLERSAINFALAIWVMMAPCIAQAVEDKPVYRCPSGASVRYTDEITSEEARQRGCRKLDDAPQSAQTSKDDSVRIEKISQKITDLSKRLGSGVNGVRMNWGENKEVVETKSWAAMKRIAATRAIIWNLQENDAKLFPDSRRNDKQLAATLIGRLVAYAFLKELIGNSTEELGMKDFLESNSSPYPGPVFAEKHGLRPERALRRASCAAMTCATR